MEEILKEIELLKNKLEELKISQDMQETIVAEFISIRANKMFEIMPRYISKND